MPEWLPQLGAAGAVIYVVILFLKELRAMGASRDEEREKFIRTIDEQGIGFREAIVRLVQLAQSMVDRCQAGVPSEHCVTGQDVMEATTRQGGKDVS